MWTISLPLAVPVSTHKDFPLNLNHYRNAHHQVLHKAKVGFEERVSPFLRGLPRMDACQIEYVFYPPDKSRRDTSNVCAIVDKFFSDTLVNAGLIPDDNYNVVVSVLYRFGEVDKRSPRVDAIITPIEPKEEKMQITLIQSEIEQAISDFISSQVSIKDGMAIKIELRATRGAEGFQANIDIVPADQLVEVSPAPVAAVAVQVSHAKQTKTEVAEVKKSPEEAPVAAVQSQPETSDVGKAAVAEPTVETEPDVVAPVVEEEVAVQEEAAALVETGSEAEAPAAAEAQAEESAPAAEPSTKARSLFAGLAKPVNA